MQINTGFRIGKPPQSVLLQEETLQAVIVAVVSTLIFRAISYFQRTRALVKFLQQMTNSVARSKPFQGNKKHENFVEFYNLTRVTKGNIAPPAMNQYQNVIISYPATRYC